MFERGERLMKRAEIRRKEREKQKKKATYVMTEEELEKIRKQEYEKAKKLIIDKSDEMAEEILKLMLVIPTNVLISDYWKKTAKLRIPKFVEDCMSLYDSWTKGAVSMEEMTKLTEEYAQIELIDSKSKIKETIMN